MTTVKTTFAPSGNPFLNHPPPAKHYRQQEDGDSPSKTQRRIASVINELANARGQPLTPSQLANAIAANEPEAASWCYRRGHIAEKLADTSLMNKLLRRSGCTKVAPGLWVLPSAPQSQCGEKKQ